MLAQRLVRKFCVKCRKKYHPSHEEFDELVAEYGAERFKNSGIQYSPDLTLYRAAGCDECSGSGYKGRFGIYEIFMVTEELQNMIFDNRPSNEIRDAARKSGMRTLREDGMRKAMAGKTSLAEVIRITATDEE